ncbi:hypothetical protein CY0110_18632 [Crocosphaera chwakensis CCY0110]|uniref:Uncharacterized protein n=1 Tax=Crocosphaera chwakensis CCY0110 TaxID=391612 RepID=A3IJ58_9CHRO|nr:hypothetical protein CY0110_18632 [Crocosphaera chwakensis CCY0110]
MWLGKLRSKRIKLGCCSLGKRISKSNPIISAVFLDC